HNFLCRLSRHLKTSLDWTIRRIQRYAPPRALRIGRIEYRTAPSGPEEIDGIPALRRITSGPPTGVQFLFIVRAGSHSIIISVVLPSSDLAVALAQYVKRVGYEDVNKFTSPCITYGLRCMESPTRKTSTPPAS